jgi:UDP-N-acetylmuramate: L-alanyl-gamma-D-glutamyl-meso-diaminopimelate ligase
MHIHILGICGTFMGGIALIARELGHQVSGSDAHVYPPMSTQLAAAGIDLQQGYTAECLQPAPDQVIVGNALSRGNPAIEYLLRNRLNYTSGPQWLAEHLLSQSWVLAVAGTHGKTTTSSMLAWILEYAGLQPGFLIGGVPNNFGLSARTGESGCFVIEADEYDTAFFDKRSKFVHYHPRTLVMNNLEFDHADIFDDLAAIQRQFHHLVRTVPDNGLIISPGDDANLQQVIDQGCWTPVEHTLSQQAAWQVGDTTADGGDFEVIHQGKKIGKITWSLTGKHNQANALAALAAAKHAGVPPEHGVAALHHFSNVKRRMELRGEVNDIKIYDDFAHHPTAIATTLQGLRAQTDKGRILAVLEPRSNTLQMGVHAGQLADALQDADQIYLYAPPELAWRPEQVLHNLGKRLHVARDTDQLLRRIVADAQPNDTILVMSNGGFANIHGRLLASLPVRND